MGLERYEKIKNLGEGAQGNVYLAKDISLNRKVAIKSLHKSLVSDAIHKKRFEEEARTLANFNHSNIIDVYDIIVNNDGCYLIMEYFEGYPLNQYIRNITGPIPEKEAINIFLMIMDAMSYIHRKGIIHRDIKPSNIMINENSDIRLLDFGIAKNTENDTKLTQIGGSAGYTPMYMSPEHCNGSKISKSSDIYSLGVTLWQMLTGKAPYEGCTQGQIYLKVANERLPSIQSVYQNVSLKMNEIVQKATNKEPQKRYTSCDKFRKDLLKLKEHINEPPTELFFNLSIKIHDDIEAEICFNEDRHYGSKFSKSFKYGTIVEIKIIKGGYNKVKRSIEITKKETLEISLEKQKLSLSNIISESKNKLIPYIHNIKPNLLNLLSFLKLNSIWTIDTIKLKLNKNQTETVTIIENKRIETKKAIEKSLDFIKIRKKEYATYLIIFALLTASIFGLFGKNEKEPITPIVDINNPKIIPIANFETEEAKGEESLSAVKIPIILSEVSDSIVKIPLFFSGTAGHNDYRSKTDTITIQANQKIGFIDLVVFNDKIVESNETIEIELQPTANIEIGKKQNYTYTIIDDDKTPIKTTRKRPRKETRKPSQTVKQTPTESSSTSQKPIQNRNTETSIQRILKTKTWDQRSGVFGGKYFLLIRKNGSDNYLTIFDYDTEKQLGPQYKIKGKNVIKNICYKNHRLYTNKGAKALERAHLIDIRNSNSSVYFGPKIRKGYLGDGSEFTITLYRK
jgi:serine/threonine protein kinase